MKCQSKSLSDTAVNYYEYNIETGTLLGKWLASKPPSLVGTVIKLLI